MYYEVTILTTSRIHSKDPLFAYATLKVGLHQWSIKEPSIYLRAAIPSSRHLGSVVVCGEITQRLNWRCQHFNSS